MNINDCSIRKVVCISNEDNDFFSCDKNSPLLEVGKTYTIESVNVHGWHTEIELKEFPNTLFNSVCFDEIDNAEHCVCCGQVIPEGRQVCIICGKKVNGKQRQIDRIRNMSVEELTFFLFEWGDHNITICNTLCGGYKSRCGRNCVAKLKEYLESEVTE